jgi:hypothetical protein
VSQDKQLAEQLFGPAQEQKSTGTLEAVKEAFQAIAPGLNLDKIAGDIGTELKRLGVQGSAEIASALFGGGQSNVFVPYGAGQWVGRSGQEAGSAGTEGEQKDAQEVQREPHQQERGGREM